MEDNGALATINQKKLLFSFQLVHQMLIDFQTFFRLSAVIL